LRASSAPPHHHHFPLSISLSGLPPAASVLGSCLQPAPAQTPVTIVLTPPSPVVGGGVSLAPQPPPENLLTCIWYRSATATDENSRILTYFPQTSPVHNNCSAHTGRETLGPGCALNIVGLINTKCVLHISLRVSGKCPHLPPPGSCADPIHVPAPHIPAPAIGTDTVLWLRDGASLVPSERLGLSPDNRTLTVLGAIRDDAGTYQCKVGNPVSTNRSEPSTVTVACDHGDAAESGVGRGAVYRGTPHWCHPSPDPVPLCVDGPHSTRIDPPAPIALTLGSPLTLTCVADSIPALSYRWVLNGTDTKETGSSLTFNPTTLDHQGTYECRVHNPVTGRTAWASVAVRVTGTGESPGWSNALQTQGSQCWHQCPSAVLGGARLQGAGWGDCG
uniref:Ig-like domain-containing protein n=1 Tax=Chrysemys picta bellii TaxID=8478 RepID=A0A8C3FMJ8_CHRPI